MSMAFDRLGALDDAEIILRRNMSYLTPSTLFSLKFAHILERQGKINEANGIYQKGLKIYTHDQVLETEYSNFIKRTGNQELASIFLSHSHADKTFVNQISRDLITMGVRVWVDEAEIEIGDSLIEKIRNGIDNVDYVGVVISKTSVESEWVKKEVDIAMNQEIEGRQVKVLPLLIDDCDLPGFLKGKMYADFRHASTYSRELNKLSRRLGVKDAYQS